MSRAAAWIGEGDMRLWAWLGGIVLVVAVLLGVAATHREAIFHGDRPCASCRAHIEPNHEA